MKLLVGLGNPDPQYERTRHNAGFLMLDLVAEQFGVSISNGKFQGCFGKGQVWDETCFFLKPLTYMNRSGVCVAGFLNFYKIDSADMIVLHDDLDIESGKVKARAGGSDGGHKGIRSIIAETGRDDFARIKIGIGRPPASMQGMRSTADWVLDPFFDEELIAMQQQGLEATLLRLKGLVKKAKLQGAEE